MALTRPHRSRHRAWCRAPRAAAGRVDADRRDAALVVAEHGEALAVGEQPLHEPVVVAVEAEQPEPLIASASDSWPKMKRAPMRLSICSASASRWRDEDRGRELRAPPAVEVLDQPLAGGLLEQEPGSSAGRPRWRVRSALRMRMASAIISRRTAWPIRSSSESSLLGVPGSGRGAGGCGCWSPAWRRSAAACDRGGEAEPGEAAARVGLDRAAGRARVLLALQELGDDVAGRRTGADDGPARAANLCARWPGRGSAAGRRGSWWRGPRGCARRRRAAGRAAPATVGRRRADHLDAVGDLLELVQRWSPLGSMSQTSDPWQVARNIRYCSSMVLPDPGVPAHSSDGAARSGRPR